MYINLLPIVLSLKIPAPIYLLFGDKGAIFHGSNSIFSIYMNMRTTLELFIPYKKQNSKVKLL